MDNENNNQKTKNVIIIILSLLVFILIIFLLFDKKESSISNQPTTINEVIDGKEVAINKEDVVGTTGSSPDDKYRQEIPKDAFVPEIDTVLSEEQKKKIALPSIVIPASTGSESSYRSFDIKAENGVFVPSQINANVGDTIRINFTAVDKNYDISFPSYSMNQKATQGQTKMLEFQAVSAGNFLYYCESCGGENSSAKGNIIILE